MNYMGEPFLLFGKLKKITLVDAFNIYFVIVNVF